MNNSDESRDYDIRKLKDLDDERFVITAKEAFFAESLFFGTMIIALLVSYAFCPADMEKMTYILGLPLWFFLATVVLLLSWAFVLYHNAKISKDFSLNARIDDEEDENYV